MSVRSRVDGSHELLDDTAIDITLSAESSEVELSEIGHKKTHKRKSRGCCGCCNSDKQNEEQDDAKYGPYRMGIAGSQK